MWAMAAVLPAEEAAADTWLRQLRWAHVHHCSVKRSTDLQLSLVTRAAELPAASHVAPGWCSSCRCSLREVCCAGRP